jgi:hypothetical protein
VQLVEELILVRDCLYSQEFFDAPIAIESPEPTSFRTAMRQRSFVVDSHCVDVDRTVLQNSQLIEIGPLHTIFKTYPLSICLAIRRPLPRLSVNTAAERP